MVSKLLIAIGAIVVIILVIALAFMGMYNGVVSSEQNVNEKWAQVESQYQRRIDLIPNLVATVKGAGNFEASTLEKITQLRSQWQTSTSVDAKVQTANELESTISKLLIISENYPTLTATQSYKDLMVELSGTENRVAFARGEYNIAVKEFNTKIKTMPTNFIAGMFGFKEKTFFESKTGAENAPVVNFP